MKILRSLYIFTTVIFLSCVSVDRYSYIGYTWSPKLVRKCTDSTSVLFVEYPSGGILGAGVVISKTGRVLTVAHLFTHGTYSQVKMVTTNGNEYDIRVLAVNARVDLSLVEPTASTGKFIYARLQRSSHLDVGQDVLVVGHPQAEYWTVTTGIISRLPWSMAYFCHTIETDAIINPGTSGGPMFNTDGEVIGVVSAMLVNMLGKTGIGIAIPIGEIHHFIKVYEASSKKQTQRKRYRLGDTHE